MGLLEKIFGTHSENELKRIYPIVDRIEAMDEEMQQLSDTELKGKTAEFKKRLEEGETLDDILPEAFAVVREAASRTLHAGVKVSVNTDNRTVSNTTMAHELERIQKLYGSDDIIRQVIKNAEETAFKNL